MLCCGVFNYEYGKWGGVVKTFLLSISGIIVLVLVVELFCPTKVMKKSLYMAFSLVVLVLFSSGVISFFSNINSSSTNTSFSLGETSARIIKDKIDYTEQNLKKILKNEGVDCTSVSIDFEIDELETKYTSVTVYITDEVYIEKTKEVVSKVLKIDKQAVSVWVS